MHKLLLPVLLLISMILLTSCSLVAVPVKATGDVVKTTGDIL